MDRGAKAQLAVQPKHIFHTLSKAASKSLALGDKTAQRGGCPTSPSKSARAVGNALDLAPHRHPVPVRKGLLCPVALGWLFCHPAALSPQESRVSACCRCEDEGRELWRVDAAEPLWHL